MAGGGGVMTGEIEWKHFSDATIIPVVDRLQVLENKLDLEGRYVSANTAHLAIEAITELLKAARNAECAIEELCHDKDPSHQCWVVMAEITATIAMVEGLGGVRAAE
jgi:hypothetical protein